MNAAVGKVLADKDRLVPTFTYQDTILTLGTNEFICQIQSFIHEGKFWFTLNVPNPCLEPYEFFFKCTEIEHELICKAQNFPQKKFFSIVLDALFYHREKIISMNVYFISGARLGDSDTMQQKVNSGQVRKLPKSKRDQMLLLIRVQSAAFFVLLNQVSPEAKHKLRFEPQHLVRIERIENDYIPSVDRRFNDYDTKFDAFTDHIENEHEKLVKVVDQLLNTKISKVHDRMHHLADQNQKMYQSNVSMQRKIVELQGELNTLRKDMTVVRYQFSEEVRLLQENTNQALGELTNAFNQRLKKLAREVQKGGSVSGGTTSRLNMSLPLSGRVSAKASPRIKGDIPLSARSNSSLRSDTLSSPRQSTLRIGELMIPPLNISTMSNNFGSIRKDLTKQLESVGQHFTFTWDPEHKHANLILSHDWQHVRNVADQGATIIGKHVFSRKDQGIYEWDIKLIRGHQDKTSYAAIYVGVAHPLIEPSEKCGYIKNSWSMYTRRGKILHEGEVKDYIKDKELKSKEYHFLANDIISVTLDMKEKTLAYSLNGKSFGVAFSNIVGPVVPCVTIMGAYEIALV